MPIYEFSAISSYVKDMEQYEDIYSKDNLIKLKGEVLRTMSNPLFAEMEFHKRADLLEEIILTFTTFYSITKVELNDLYVTFLNSDNMTKQ